MSESTEKDFKIDIIKKKKMGEISVTDLAIRTVWYWLETDKQITAGGEPREAHTEVPTVADNGWYATQGRKDSLVHGRH